MANGRGKPNTVTAKTGTWTAILPRLQTFFRIDYQRLRRRLNPWVRTAQSMIVSWTARASQPERIRAEPRTPRPSSWNEAIPRMRAKLHHKAKEATNGTWVHWARIHARPLFRYVAKCRRNSSSVHCAPGTYADC